MCLMYHVTEQSEPISSFGVVVGCGIVQILELSKSGYTLVCVDGFDVNRTE